MGPPLLDRALYSFTEAARLLDVPAQTVRRWIDGYQVKGVEYPPVVRQARTGSDEVTWGEFVEAGLLREYRRRGISLQSMRPLVEQLRREFDVTYPLAHFKPAVDESSRELVFELQKMTGLDEDLYLVRRSGPSWQLQWAEPVQEFLHKVEFDEDGVARRMYLLGRDHRVAVDPELTFGLPQVLGIRTETIAEAFASGESVEGIAASWSIEMDDVFAAIRWELNQQAA